MTTAAGHKIHAKASVVATNSPFNDLVTIHTKQAPYHTYAIGARVAPGAITPALYWDTEDPYHYIRLHRTTNRELGGDNADPVDVLIVGGEDHKAGQAQDADARFARLQEWMRAHFPAAGELEFRWSGQVMETVDGLGFLGRNPLDADNVYVATGDSGMGMTHGTIAAWSHRFDKDARTLDRVYSPGGAHGAASSLKKTSTRAAYNEWFRAAM